MPIVGNTSSQRKSVPNPPTIGSATAGPAQASVSFTPSTFNGKLPISFYTAVSNPGSISATSTSTPVVVSDLTGGTAYTFTVLATNPVGQSSASSSSNSVTPTIPSFFALGNVDQNLEAWGAYVDSSGNTYAVVGGADSSNTTYNGAFLVKFSQAGNILWQKRLYTVNQTFRANGVVFDSLLGSPTVLYSSQGTPFGGIIANYTNNGDLQWARTLTRSGGFYVGGNPYGQPLSSGHNNNAFCGFYDNSSSSVYAGYLVKYNNNPSREWIKAFRLGTVSAPYNTTILRGTAYDNVSGNGDIFAVGRTNSATNNYGYRSLTMKVDQSGNQLWAKTLSDSNSSGNQQTELYSCALDSSNNVYVCGEYRLPSSGSQGHFIAKYNSSGTLQWQRFVTSSKSINYIWGATCDSSGNQYYLMNEGSPNSLVILKVNSSGTLQWQRNIYSGQATPYQSLPASININSNGRIALTSYFYNNNDQSGPFIANLNSDGSGTGTYNTSNFTVNYVSASTISLSTGNLTDASENNVGPFNPASTDADSTSTNTNGTLTRQVVSF